jgi:hypothetical protein
VKASIAALIVLLVLAGCGGNDHPKSKSANAAGQTATTEHGGEPRSEGAGGEEEDKKGLSRIPVEDRRAFVQIGVAISRLTTGASVLLVKGLARPEDRVVLERLLPQVGALQPHDPQLRRLRTRTLKALGNAIHVRNSPNISRRTGETLMTESNRLLKALRRYQRSSPAIGALIPD